MCDESGTDRGEGSMFTLCTPLIPVGPGRTWGRLKTLFNVVFKDVIRNRFNFILEERVQFSEQNSENLMKIGWKIRKLWNFEISQIFKKQFLTSRYEYANEWVDDVIASQFSIHIVYRNDKNVIFQLRER